MQDERSDASQNQACNQDRKDWFAASALTRFFG